MSKSHQKSFVELCLEGDALMDEIDDYVAEWHRSSSKLSDIHQFLGMTRDEYALWVSEPDSLAYIVAAHRQNRPVRSVVEEINRLPMAARAADQRQAERVMEWLKRHLHKSR